MTGQATQKNNSAIFLIGEIVSSARTERDKFSVRAEEALLSLSKHAVSKHSAKFREDNTALLFAGPHAAQYIIFFNAIVIQRRKNMNANEHNQDDSRAGYVYHQTKKSASALFFPMGKSMLRLPR